MNPMSPIQLSEKLRSSMNGRSDPTMINYGINTVVDLLYFLLSADIRRGCFDLHVATCVIRTRYVRLFRCLLSALLRRVCQLCCRWYKLSMASSKEDNGDNGMASSKEDNGMRPRRKITAHRPPPALALAPIRWTLFSWPP